MRFVIQRVLNASVIIEKKVSSTIGQGLLVYVGINKHDTDEDCQEMANKLLNLKLWADNNKERPKQWKTSVMDNNYDVLFVSNFTLYCAMKGGNKPDFSLSMKPNNAMKVYENLLEMCKSIYKNDKVFDGVFGKYMFVNASNDGPVTIVIESSACANDKGQQNSNGNAQMTAAQQAKQKNKQKQKLQKQQRQKQQREKQKQSNANMNARANHNDDGNCNDSNNNTNNNNNNANDNAKNSDKDAKSEE